MGTNGPVRAFFIPLRSARAFFERRLCSRVEVKVPGLDGLVEDAAANFDGSRDISREGNSKLAISEMLVPSRVKRGASGGRLLVGVTAHCGLSSAAAYIFERLALFADLLEGRVDLDAFSSLPSRRPWSAGDL